MKSAFDANVPKRKPRTRLSTMLAEIEPQETIPSEPPRPAPKARRPEAELPVPEAVEAEAPVAKVEAPVAKVEVEAPVAKVEVEAPVAKVEAPVAKVEAPAEPAARLAPNAAPVARVEAPATPSAGLAPAEAAAQAHAEALAARAAALAAHAEALAARAQVLEAPRSPVAEASPRPAVTALSDRAQLNRVEARAPEIRRLDSPVPAPAAAEVHEAKADPNDPVASGRARIERLKQRLEVAARRHAEPTPEPATTASRVKETVSTLRERIEKSASEQRATIQALEQTRRALAEAQTLLDVERRHRVEAEALAEERQTIAESLLAESEAMAEERDQALARISDLRELDLQQAKLLEDMEGQLEAERGRLQDARHQATELRAALEAVNAEVELAEVRLDQLRSEKRAVEERAQRLESEILRSTGAREALTEIQRLVESLG